MTTAPASHADRAQTAAAVLGFLLFGQGIIPGTDWPQYRGPMNDGSSPDPIATVWDTNSPGFVVWTNHSVTNGFSSFAVSQGRAFALMSKTDTDGTLREFCAAVDAATGTNLWATPIDDEPWDPDFGGDGGAGTAPYWKGDGPRSTPSVKDGRVVALSGLMHLVCMNATNGAVLWSNDLKSAYGASTIGWDNAASPCLDEDLVFVNLNSSSDYQNLAAFRMTDGSAAWRWQNEGMTHATPVVATIAGVRQVIFPTQTGLVSLDRTTGALLWRFNYPWGPIYTSMGASPVVHSNIVFCTAAYNKGATAARIALTNSAWTVTQLWYKNSSAGVNYQSIWMSPVCYQGHIYTLCGGNTTFLSTPLNCIDLATGDLKWAMNDFGMGGVILVNTNLVVLTEKGELVLVRPDPGAYTELARYKAFDFSNEAPGKCWNHPAFSDGRIYARSTRGGICVNVSVAPPAQLKMLTPAAFPGQESLELWVGTTTGSAIDADRAARLEVRYTTDLRTPLASWRLLTNSLALTNGLVRVDQVNVGSPSYFIAVEQLTVPPLKMLTPQVLPEQGLRLWVGTATGSLIASNRLAQMAVEFTTTLPADPADWTPLGGSLVLTNGLVWVDDLPGSSPRYYRAVELNP